MMHQTMNVNNKSLISSLAKIIDNFLALIHESIASVFMKGLDVEDWGNQFPGSLPFCTIDQEKPLL